MLKVHVRKGESLSNALYRASQKFGMPMTKMITHYCPLCVHAVSSLEEHFAQMHPKGTVQVAEDYHSDDEVAELAQLPDF